MDFSLNQTISTDLRQSQQLSAVQLQRLDILQVSTQILEQRIAMELQQNPLLELADSGDTEICESDLAPSNGEITDDAVARLAEYDENTVSTLADSNAGDAAFDNYVNDLFHRNGDADDEERRRHFFDSITYEDDPFQTLFDAIDDHAGKDQELAQDTKLLAGQMDDNGYLSNDTATIAASLNLPEERINRAINLLQQMEPAGIGAQSLQECLLLQLARKSLKGSLAWEIITDYLDDLAHNRIPAIAKALDVAIDEIQDAAALIRNLNPRPGSALFVRVPPFLRPDVFIERNAKGLLQVRMNYKALPTMTLSQEYLDMLDDSATDDSTKKYIREKKAAASQLLDAIDMRWTTLEKISVELLHRQAKFFDTGREEDLVPMTLADIAGTLSVSESTISRGISEKYLSTPFNIYPFKYFFRAGYQSDSGTHVSNIAIVQKIRKMIEGENPQKPLSDQVIADRLQADGLEVARRTVAKYREAVGIQAASMRKIHT